MNKSSNFSEQPIIKQLLNLITTTIITRTATEHKSNLNPNKQWEELTTKPLDKQLSLF